MTSTADLIPISENADIPGPPDEVWAILSDPMVVMTCVPGAAITAQRPDGSYEAIITVRFGPTVARFSGEATVEYDHAGRRCNIEGRGIDQRGASRALVALQVALEGQESSQMSVTGGFNVAGPLETFASAGGVQVARALLAEFATNVALLIKAEDDAAPRPQASKDTPAPEIEGGRLVWQAFLSWLRQLFRREP